MEVALCFELVLDGSVDTAAESKPLKVSGLIPVGEGFCKRLGYQSIIGCADWLVG